MIQDNFSALAGMLSGIKVI